MTRLILALSVFLLALPNSGGAQVVTFLDAAVGSPPPGFALARTGSGPPGRWEIIRDDTAADGKVLAQLSGDTTDYRFPLAIYLPSSARNVEVAAKFKAISGRVDQSGGIVVRYADANNYYVARANALEDNVRFYRVVRGRRQQLASADTKVTPREWHTLTLRAEGDRFAISFDGKLLYTATDKTFGASGKVGLWTKADSVTHFERIEIKTLP